MTGDVLVEERVRTTRATAPVAWLLLTSLMFAALQASLTDYGQAGGAAFAFGLAVCCWASCTPGAAGRLGRS
jgi:hypothetical protein